MANSRIYVQEIVAEKFVEVFKKLASERKMGDLTKGEINHGLQVDKTQFEAVNKYILVGKESGAFLALGDSTNPVAKFTGESKSLFIYLTIFLNALETSRIMKEEIFGPIVVINTFSFESEVISKANDTEFSLYACLYTKDIERALRVSKKLESGMVGVNCAAPTGCWDLPFGGWKGSGTGRKSLLESMEHFLEVKSIYFKFLE